MAIMCVAHESSDYYAEFQKELVPVERDGKWGFVNGKLQVVIPPQFEAAKQFSEGRAAVKQYGMWGYVDTAGKVAIQPQFEDAGEFSEGYADVSVGGKRGYIDASGKFVIAPQFDSSSNFFSGFAFVSADGKPTFVDREGRPANEDAMAVIDKAEISLERTICFGSCPVYTVNITGAGDVTYQGKQFVKVTGRKRYKIDQSEVRGLIEKFYSSNFFSLKGSYVQKIEGEYITSVTDLPSVTTIIKLGGKTKKVYDYAFAPKRLVELEKEIDKVARTDQWMSTPSR
jgi:hypothetical protein